MSPRKRGPRRRGGEYLAEAKQDPIYDQRLSNEADFLALSHNVAFQELVRKNQVGRQTNFILENSVEMELEDMPQELQDAFFFPSHLRLEKMSLSFAETPDPDDKLQMNTLWTFGGSFVINNTQYSMQKHTKGVELSTEGPDGSPLTYQFDGTVFTKFLATIIVSSIHDLSGFDHKQRLKIAHQGLTPAERARIIGEYDVPLDPSSLRRLMDGLGQTNGKVVESIKAAFSSYDDSRIMLVTLKETETPHVSGISTDIDLAFYLTGDPIDVSGYTINESTEVSGFVREVHRPYALQNSYMSFGPTSVEPQDYMFNKLFEDALNLSESHLQQAQPDTDDWFRSISIFMTSITPLLYQAEQSDR